jgi:hypothetical protein
MRYDDDTSWLDPMRNAMGELEQQCHAFGLPGNVGFECWSWKEFAAACKQANAETVDLFLRLCRQSQKNTCGSIWYWTGWTWMGRLPPSCRPTLAPNRA